MAQLSAPRRRAAAARGREAVWRFGPLLPPGSGRARVVALHAGESLAAERDLAAERTHLAALAEALPFLGEADDGGRWLIDEPELGLAAVETLSRLPAVVTLEWPQGQPLKVLAPPKPMVLKVRSGRDWFAVDGTLQVDEQQVLTLRELLALWNEAKGSRYLPLAPGAWLALTERLRQQLADCRPWARPRTTNCTAAAWLAQAGDEAAPQGAPWRKRLARLEEAATLAPAVPAALQALGPTRPKVSSGWRAWHTPVLGRCWPTTWAWARRCRPLHCCWSVRASARRWWWRRPRWWPTGPRSCSSAPSLRALTYADSGRSATLADLGAGDVLLVSYGLLLRDAALSCRKWRTLLIIRIAVQIIYTRQIDDLDHVVSKILPLSNSTVMPGQFPTRAEPPVMRLKSRCSAGVGHAYECDAFHLIDVVGPWLRSLKIMLLIPLPLRCGAA